MRRKRLRTYADSDGPDQPAHPRSLIRALAVRKQHHWILKNVSVESKCPDETAHTKDDVNPHILRMLKSAVSLDVALLIYLQ